MCIIKNSFIVSVMLPEKDLNSWGDKNDITIHTELDTISNNFIFKCTIPKYVFDGVKDSDTKYLTNPPKLERGQWGSKPKPFTQKLSCVTLGTLLDQLSDICRDAIDMRKRETAETERYIAVKFVQSNTQRKDDFNFASMGFATSSMFQFFNVYKIIKSPHSLDQYTYKSNVRIGGENYSHRKGEWHYYGIGVIEKYQLIKWTQEREDFLQSVQDKFVAMNEQLETFLGNIDDDKIMELMANSQFLLGNGK